MQDPKNFARTGKYCKGGVRAGLCLLAAMNCLGSVSAQAHNPLSAKVEITPLQSYSGGSSLPKPDKILVYDFVTNSDTVQVDQSQKIRPRHLITGDAKPDAIAKQAQTHFSAELQKRLAKTGLPVEHVAADTAPTDNSLVVQGSFLSLKQGDKTQRVAVGMGAGSAEMKAEVDVRLKTAADAILVSQFQTATTTAKNIGGVVPVAAGMNPAAVGMKSTVTDRKKTLNSYASKTADATAAEIERTMAQQGWIKLNDKGEVIP